MKQGQAERCAALLLFLLAAGLPAAARAEDTAKAWFQRMGQAVETLTYRGTLVHVVDNRPETLEVLHKVENDRVFERMTSLSGSGLEIVRIGDEVRCILEDDKEVLVDWRDDQSPLRSVLPEYDEELERFYSFRHRPGRRHIANRPTHFVAVEPRDEFRYGYRLWLDAETAMPLVCQLVSETGRVLEAVQFTDISYNVAMTKDDFRPRLDNEGFKQFFTRSGSDSEPSAHSTAPHWQVADLPAGFLLSVVRRHDGPAAPVEHLVFTDGLASISVFAEKYSSAHETLAGETSFGVSSAFGRRVDEFQITVVGEVPLQTVRRVGNSVRPAR